eukprot:5207170-Amphidinium_carterae.1
MIIGKMLNNNGNAVVEPVHISAALVSFAEEEVAAAGLQPEEPSMMRWVGAGRETLLVRTACNVYEPLCNDATNQSKPCVRATNMWMYGACVSLSSRGGLSLDVCAPVGRLAAGLLAAAVAAPANAAIDTAPVTKMKNLKTGTVEVDQTKLSVKSWCSSPKR